MEKTIVPRWLLLKVMEQNMKRPPDVCTFCGNGGKLEAHTVTFTRDNHSEIDGKYDVRVCERCEAIMWNHPSFMLEQ